MFSLVFPCFSVNFLVFFFPCFGVESPCFLEVGWGNLEFAFCFLCFCVCVCFFLFLHCLVVFDCPSTLVQTKTHAANTTKQFEVQRSRHHIPNSRVEQEAPWPATMTVSA